MDSLLKLNKKLLMVALASLLPILLFSVSAFSFVHYEHTNNGIKCISCHNSFMHQNTGRTNAVNSFKYLNGDDDDVATGGPIGTTEGTYVSGMPNTCQNVDCHAENTVATDEVVTCSSCHFDTADTNDFTYLGVTPVMAKIDSAQWTNTGHGRLVASGNYISGNPPANFTDCTTYCHTTSVAHGESATNPFRLITNGGAVDFSDVADPQLDNTVCLDCHSATGVTSGLATAYPEENHFTAKALANNGQISGGSFCWDCHDPHGDTNDYMLHETITKTSDGVFGIPQTYTAAFVFSKAEEAGEDLDGPGVGIDSDPLAYDWADYVKDVTFDGVCQVCHDFTIRFKGGAGGDYASTHNHSGTGVGQRCTACHAHQNDFTASCNTCHNYTDIGCNTDSSWPSNPDVGWDPVLDTTTHEKHVCSPVAMSCSDCHGHNGSGATHNQGTAANKGAGTPVDAAFVTIDLANIATDPAYWNGNGTNITYSGTPGVDSATIRKTCDNTTCHYGLSPDWGMEVACTDLDPSTILITDPANGTNVTIGTPVNVTVSLTAGDADIANAEYETSDNPGVWNALATPWDTSALTDGVNYTVTARATDPDCNEIVYDTSVVTAVAAPSMTPFGPISHYANPDTGTNLGNDVTNVTCGTDPLSGGNWVILEPSPTCGGDGTNRVRISLKPPPSATTILVTAIRNTTRADGIEITTWDAEAWAKDKDGGDITLTFELIDYFNGTVVPIASATDPTFLPTNVDSLVSVTGVSAGNYLLQAGHKIGLRVIGNFTGTASTDFRMYLADKNPPITNFRMILTYSGNSADGTGLAPPAPGSVTDITPAPPETTGGGTTPLACNTCHQFGPDDDVAGAKNIDGVDQYYYPNVGDHTKHGMTNIAGGVYASPTNVDAQGTCTTCHESGDILTPTDWTTNHRTGNIDFAASIKGGTYDPPTKTCTGVSCHGASNPVWGVSVMTCFDCHSGVEADNKPQISLGTPNPIDQTQYNTTGHGQWVVGPTYPNECYECHNSVAAHTTKDPNDPFRLGVNAQNMDNVCLNACHGVGGTSIYTDMLSHTKTVIGSLYTWPFVPKCIDCHDPHGDANIKMIRPKINVATNNNNPGGGSYDAGDGDIDGDTYIDYGIQKSTAIAPADAASQNSQLSTAISFTNNTIGKGAGGFAGGAGSEGTGICEVCHQNTPRYNRQGDTNNDGHPPDPCTNCHNHAQGFKGAGGGPGSNCLGCHNVPQGLRRSIQLDFEMTYTHAVTWATMSGSDCENCHTANHSDGGAITLKVWDPGGATFVGVNYTGGNTANQACLSCHDSDGGPAFSSGLTPPNINARWQNGATTTPYNKYPDGGTGAYPNTVPVLQKSYSPHAMPGTNDNKGASNTTGEIGCVGTGVAYGCHTAHGSNFGSGADGTIVTTRRMLNNNGGAYTATDFDEKLCWGCHPDDGFDYYGDDSVQGDGIGWQGTWNNSIATYKAGNYQSSHFYPSLTATWNGSGIPSGTRNNIYCSTCHNPHGLLPDAQDPDSPFKVPILRGTWLTSPYKEDRAPGSVTSNPGTNVYAPWNDTNNDFGPLPRVTPNKDQADVEPGGGYTGTYKNGWDGFFIDQNTFGPGVYITNTGAGPNLTSETEFAGLCMNCHTKNYLVTLASWNGHNTVLGWDTAPGATFNDIFDGQAGSSDGTTGSGKTNTGGSEWMFQYFGGASVDYGQGGSSRKYGTRSGDTSPIREPTIDNKYAYNGTNWGLNYATQSSAGGIQQGFHKYPCSKCHNPHAARLPRLMRTNCLDNGSYATGHVNETLADDYGPGTDYSDKTVSGSHTPTGTAEYQALVVNLVTTNWEAANCHSVAGSNAHGWNTLTPWDGP